jgi:hypothetical protein
MRHTTRRPPRVGGFTVDTMVASAKAYQQQKFPELLGFGPASRRRHWLRRPASGQTCTFWSFSRRQTATRIRAARTRAAGDFPTWCARRRCCVDHHRAATTRRELDRAADADAVTVDRQAAPSGDRPPHLFEWLVTGGIVPHNPAASVRGPSSRPACVTCQRGRCSARRYRAAQRICTWLCRRRTLTVSRISYVQWC